MLLFFNVLIHKTMYCNFSMTVYMCLLWCRSFYWRFWLIFRLLTLMFCQRQNVLKHIGRFRDESTNNQSCFSLKRPRAEIQRHTEKEGSGLNYIIIWKYGSKQQWNLNSTNKTEWMNTEIFTQYFNTSFENVLYLFEFLKNIYTYFYAE